MHRSRVTSWCVFRDVVVVVGDAFLNSIWSPEESAAAIRTWTFLVELQQLETELKKRLEGTQISSATVSLEVEPSPSSVSSLEISELQLKIFIKCDESD